MLPRIILVGLLITGLLASCESVNRKMQLIEGEWEGVVLLEEGDSVLIDPANLAFTFNRTDQTYTYRSTLNYREAGDFYVQSRYLFTRDTLQSDAAEKVVELMHLSADSLHLKMSEQGRERVMKLGRPR